MPWFSCLGGYLSPMITLWYVAILWTLRFGHGMPLDLEISLYASLSALVCLNKYFYSKMSTILKNYPGTGLASCPVYDFSPTNHTKCMRCSFCTKHWIQTHTFTSAVTTCKFNVPIKDVSMNFSCHSKNVIYLITCTKCEVQYVGLTRQKIKERIAQHIRHIKNNSLSTYLVQHFNNNDHSISDLIVKIIDYLPETKDNVN